MNIIAFYDCKDLNEARQKEQDHFVALNANLNSVEPLPSKKLKRAKNIRCIKKVKRSMPLMRTGSNMLSYKKQKKCFVCEPCNFITTCKGDYNRHILTEKHLSGGGKAITPIKAPDGYLCPCCHKLFKSRTSVYKHTPVCITINNTTSLATTSNSIPPRTPNTQSCLFPVSEEVAKNLTNMMMALFQQNAELHSKMLELCKNTGLSNNQITNCANSNNHTFNMKTFLNEKCKDAMNMKDFVDSIQVNMTDVENVERLGYVQGMSNIILNNLKKTDVYKRPVHCSDAKRATLYINDDNLWERDGQDHPKMMNAVLVIEHKLVDLVNEWVRSNPRCMNSRTDENKKYIKLSKAFTNDNKDGNIAKVIKRVAKQVTVEKE
jgi:hypothetical protein